MADDAGKGSSSTGRTDWGAAAKWVAVGVVAIVFLVLFRDELKGLIRDTKEVEITKTGVSLKTVRTPLGDTVLSDRGAVLTPVGLAPIPQAAAGAKPPPALAGRETFTDPDHGFSISWPGNGEWSRNDAMRDQMGMGTMLRLLVHYREPYAQFTPNVNIVAEPVGDLGIDAVMQRSAQGLTSLGWQVREQQVDAPTASGVLVVFNPAMSGGLFQVQRIVVRNRTAFYITASKLESDPRPEPYAQMGEILNSFRF